MRVIITPTETEASTLAARHIIDHATPGMKLGVATGSTPLGLYANLRTAHETGAFSLADSTAWALDEYVGIDENHPERYRNVLRDQLVGDDKTGLTDDNLHTPNPYGDDLDAAAAEYEAALSEGVDIQILGLGSDGHIGFNEPAGSLASPTHVETLTHETREANSRFFDNDIDKVPTHCITQGLATIMRASDIVLLAFGRGKARAVAQLIEGPVSAMWPATILQHHPSVMIIVDEEAASELTMIDYYRSREHV